MKRELHIIDLGLMPYEQAQELQDRLVDARLRGQAPDRLLLLEHPRVFTYSPRKGLEHLRLSPEQVQQSGVALCPTDRGGDITYHGPGQIVAYLIVRLEGGERSVPDLFVRLEQAVIGVLREHGVDSHGGTQSGQRGPANLSEAGVWVGQNKICAIGLKLSRWVTKHGLALNVDVDLHDYQMITACGLAHRGLTSMHAQGATFALVKQVKHELGQQLASCLGRVAVDASRSSLDTPAQKSI